MEFIDKHIFVCGVPHYDTEQTSEHITETTPIMNDNNQPTHEQTTEHIIIPESELFTPEALVGMRVIVGVACLKGSRVYTALQTLMSLDYDKQTFERSARAYNLAKTICKRVGLDSSNYESFAISIYHDTIELIRAIEANKTVKTTTRKGGIVDTACMNYAVGIIRGDILKSARVAKNCKDLALKMLVNPGFDINDLPMSVDSLANKVYASIRSQATKNGEQFAKSNTATKNAVKTALIETIEALRLDHGTEYEILIDNMPKQPKHLSV